MYSIFLRFPQTLRCLILFCKHILPVAHVKANHVSKFFGFLIEKYVQLRQIRHVRQRTNNWHIRQTWRTFQVLVLLPDYKLYSKISDKERQNINDSRRQKDCHITRYENTMWYKMYENAGKHRRLNIVCAIYSKLICKTTHEWKKGGALIPRSKCKN